MYSEERERGGSENVRKKVRERERERERGSEDVSEKMGEDVKMGGCEGGNG